MEKWKDNISFVLIEPKKHGNIGASARAMKNMGFKNLCLVRPPRILTDEAGLYAHNSLDILGNAVRFDNVAEAVIDKALVVGVARRTGKKRGLVFRIDEGAGRIRRFSEKNRVAILFGREDRGLYNTEIDECGFIVTIPSNKEHPSLNLSHAVMVVAYELTMSERRDYDKPEDTTAPDMTEGKAVEQRELAALYKRIEEALLILDYLPRGDRDIKQHIMNNIRHFIGRSGVTYRELKMLHGICSQIEKKIKTGMTAVHTK